MSARDIKWTKADIDLLAVNSDFPWIFMPYDKVKPTVWYNNQGMGNHLPVIRISTAFTNIPEGYVPVSPVVQVDGGKTSYPSHAINDHELIPFIYNDPRFCVVPLLTGNTRSDGQDGPATAWGCQKEKNPFMGIRMWRLLCEGTDYCPLGDQLTSSNFNPGKMCEGAGKNYYETAADNPTTIYAVHRHLVVWNTVVSPDYWFPRAQGSGGEILRASCYVRLNASIAMFRDSYQNMDGNNARPLTLRNILRMSISNNDAAIELADRARLEKNQISISATQDNAVDMYRKHFCSANPDATECSCFREIPSMLKVSQYDVACHDTLCKTVGYKPTIMIEGKTCTDLTLQICSQVVNANNNSNSSLVIALKQQCSSLTGDTPKEVVPFEPSGLTNPVQVVVHRRTLLTVVVLGITIFSFLILILVMSS